MEFSKGNICIYHGNCADGFGAAWAVRQAHPELTFVPGHYGKPFPAVDKNTDVLLVDFSYKRGVLKTMAEYARSVLVIDHHKSAMLDLEGINAECPNVTTVFDMERSGAMMAWNYFHPGARPPALIQHIQDRDLWQFKLPHTREIQAALFSYPYDFRVWNELMQRPVDMLIAEGISLERKHFKDLEELLPLTTRLLQIDGYIVPAVNLPYTFASDAGNALSKEQPFAAVYFDGPEGRTFSLRSQPEGLDVSVIAAKFGGGGHKNAAGFKVPFDTAAFFEIEPEELVSEPTSSESCPL